MVDPLRRGLRLIARQPRFAAAVVLPLAFGFAALITAFAVVFRLLLAPLAFPDADRIFVVDQQSPALGGELPLSSGNYLDLESRQRSLAAVAAYQTVQRTRTDGPEPRRLTVAEVTPSFFDAVATRPALGAAFRREQARLPTASTAILAATPYLILGHRLWVTQFGGRSDVVGEAVALDGAPYRIVGVMPRGFDFPEHADAWAPLAFGPQAANDRGGFYLETLARLGPGLSRERAQGDLDRIAADLRTVVPEINGDLSLPLTPLRDRLVGDRSVALWLLLGLAAIIMLGIVANVAQLLLARAIDRQREIAVRLSLGAGRWALSRQLLAESSLLAGLGWLLGLGLAAGSLRLVRAFSPLDLIGFEPLRIDGWVAVSTAVFAFLIAGLFGTAPVFALGRSRLLLHLAEGDSRASLSRRQRRLQRLLMAGQLAVAVVLVSAAILVAGSYARLRAVDLGFDPRGLLSLDLTLPDSRYRSPAAVSAFTQTAVAELAGLPGVTACAAALRLPVLDEPGGIWFVPQGSATATDGAEPAATFNTVTAGYFEVMGISLLRGRGVGEQDGPDSAPVAVIDEELARRFFPGQDPLGKTLVLTPWPDIPRTIVGVARGVRQGGIRGPSFPALYVPFTQVPIPRLRLVARTGVEPRSLIRAAQETIWRVDGTLAFDAVAPFEDRLAGVLRPETFSLGLVTGFGLLGLLLVGVGVYSSTAYMVSRRRSEHGIRLALGGRPGDIVRHVVWGGLPEVATGLGMGIAAVFALARVGRSILFEVSPTDPWLLGWSVAVLLFVAGSAMAMPARRASRLDPRQVLL